MGKELEEYKSQHTMTSLRSASLLSVFIVLIFGNLVFAKTYLVEVESGTNTDIAIKNENGSDYFFRVIGAVIGGANAVKDAGEKVGEAAGEATKGIQKVEGVIDGATKALG